MMIRCALAATIALAVVGCEEPKITEQWETEANAEADSNASPVESSDAGPAAD